ncbi:MAG: hypothetical protein KDD47_24870, partial [Acidobacteria bacterium]|nr:hypothetical protein [Acidobacteriota bacterium]
MSDTKETMTEALRHLAEALRKAQGGEPPTVEELLALREGKLEGENRLDLERRLSVDPQAVDELLDLTKFSRLEPPTPEHHLSDEDQARALSSLRKRLGIEGHEPRQGVDEEGAGDPGESAHEGFSRSLGRWRIFALAAALLAVVAGTWAFRLERRLETERDPRFAAVIDVHATRGE